MSESLGCCSGAMVTNNMILSFGCAMEKNTCHILPLAYLRRPLIHTSIVLYNLREWLYKIKNYCDMLSICYFNIFIFKLTVWFGKWTLLWTQKNGYYNKQTKKWRKYDQEMIFYLDILISRWTFHTHLHSAGKMRLGMGREALRPAQMERFCVFAWPGLKMVLLEWMKKHVCDAFQYAGSQACFTEML